MQSSFLELFKILIISLILVNYKDNSENSSKIEENKFIISIHLFFPSNLNIIVGRQIDICSKDSIISFVSKIKEELFLISKSDN